ncbi:cation:proton antiporter [Leifsonia sp. YIM 134122]|uniref:Cation:proton antiporter n=1 Tax=Leifsonia stereocauli TaxID=3134136 RepID=A0ABU9W571_9MICO
MDVLVIGVLGVLAIVLAAQASGKLGVAAPLLLVVLGIGVSLLPFVGDIEIEPEWILAGVLPPLLYSAAVSMPTMEFRRDFRAIAGLSVILVVVSSVLLGLLFAWLIPGLGLAAAIALGAIVSPTDAVATSIVKKLGVSPRIVAVLEGESLLNDATALVLLRSAIAATAATVSFWGVLGDFAYAVAVAVVIGVVVGWLNLRLRHRVKDAAVNTAISFTIPFIASVPAEVLGASGLVAAVAAGLVTGIGAPRWLTPAHRFSDAQNWRTIELLLEGAVFLVMGLELWTLLDDVGTADNGLWTALWIGALALVATVLVRTAYVVPLLQGLARSAKRKAARTEQFGAIQERIDRMEAGTPALGDGQAGGDPRRSRGMPPGDPTRMEDRPIPKLRPGDADRFRDRVVRYVADADYMQAEPLGVRQGAVVVWAGMRGVVTLAAAQTLPQDTESRSLLVLIAFVVAALSLLIQGGTLGWLARRLGLTGIGVNIEERERLSAELREVSLKVLTDKGIDPREMMRRSTDETASDVPDPKADFDRVRAIRVEMIDAQRLRLLELQKAGTYSSGALTWALQSLDADQISIELHAPDAGE